MTTQTINTEPKTKNRKQETENGLIPVTVSAKEYLADTVTPVALYLRLRDIFPGAVLLESADNANGKNSRSFIAIDPVATISAGETNVNCSIPSFQYRTTNKYDETIADQLIEFFSLFSERKSTDTMISGFVGYFGYDNVVALENVKVKVNGNGQIPRFAFSLYRILIAFDPLYHRLQIISQQLPGTSNDISTVEKALYSMTLPKYNFTAREESAEITDDEFLQMVEEAKKDCAAGNIFQVVLSRKFSRKFSGDEFNVYRALRAINPSPYLFYADFNNFKLFGSSPEAQLITRKEGDRLRAIIHPIAGTFKRTGNEVEDLRLEEELKNDPKENAEHIMLVDLARNDLGRNCTEVEVDSFRQAHRFSHVIHLVSEVSGIIREERNAVNVLLESFPAGTLSGAPKVRAMNIISQHEKSPRGFYGGAIGLIGFDGTMNMAIMIRTFMSKNGELHYQAGAGITIGSSAENEKKEIENKLGALRKAIETAQNI